jgi:hypothetical protein
VRVATGDVGSERYHARLLITEDIASVAEWKSVHQNEQKPMLGCSAWTLRL